MSFTEFGRGPVAAGGTRARAARAVCAAVLGCWLPTTAVAQRVPPARDAAAVRTALQQIDASLAEARTELARVDERVSATRAATGRQTSAPLVVLLRVASGATPTLLSATAGVNDGTGAARRYNDQERAALRTGAADELLRAALPPGAHTVRATVTAAGGAATRTATVTTPANGRVTYVEFTLHDGTLDAAAWVADAPAAARP